MLTDGPVGNPNDPGQVIPPLLPDLLGEWFVSRAFAAGLPVADLLDRAWRLAPDGTAAFLQRLTQDFPDHQVTADLLIQVPPDAVALAALGRVASPIFVKPHRAHRPIPAPVIAVLTTAALGRDAWAMGNLG